SRSRTAMRIPSRAAPTTAAPAGMQRPDRSALNVRWSCSPASPAARVVGRLIGHGAGIGGVAARFDRVAGGTANLRAGGGLLIALHLANELTRHRFVDREHHANEATGRQVLTAGSMCAGF